MQNATRRTPLAVHIRNMVAGAALLALAACSDGSNDSPPREVVGPNPCGAAPCTAVASRPEPPADSAGMALFLLAGQSNMAGRAPVEPQDTVTHPRIWMLTAAGAWVPARSPVQFDKPDVVGVGPGLSFARALVAADTGIVVGLIPVAMGGSPISSWAPGARFPSSNYRPYDTAISAARRAMRDGTVRAVLWHHGENDATPELAPLYADRLRGLIANFRRDLGDRDLPVLIGGLGRWPERPWTAAWARIDSAHRSVAADLPGVAFVPADGLGDMGDGLHFSAEGARELGRRYAAAWAGL